MHSELVELRGQLAELREEVVSLSCEVARLRRLLARGSELSASRAASETDQGSERGYSFVSTPAAILHCLPIWSWIPSAASLSAVVIERFSIGPNVTELQKELGSFWAVLSEEITGVRPEGTLTLWLRGCGLCAGASLGSNITQCECSGLGHWPKNW